MDAFRRARESVCLYVYVCPFFCLSQETIQRLIGSGMDPGTDNNPYLGFIYTSFQVFFV